MSANRRISNCLRILECISETILILLVHAYVAIWNDSEWSNLHIIPIMLKADQNNRGNGHNSCYLSDSDSKNHIIKYATTILDS